LPDHPLAPWHHPWTRKLIDVSSSPIGCPRLSGRVPYQAVQIGAREQRPSILADHSLPALKKWERSRTTCSSLKKIDLKAIEDQPEANTYKFLQNQLESSIGYRVSHGAVERESHVPAGRRICRWRPGCRGPRARGSAERDRALVAGAQYLDDEINNLKEDSPGYTAPKGNVQSVIAQVDAMLAAPIGTRRSCRWRSRSPASFRKALEDAERDVGPARDRKYRDFLVKTYLPGGARGDLA
jgi:hypothetical protein